MGAVDFGFDPFSEIFAGKLGERVIVPELDPVLLKLSRKPRDQAMRPLLHAPIVFMTITDKDEEFRHTMRHRTSSGRRTDNRENSKRDRGESQASAADRERDRTAPSLTAEAPGK